MTALKMRSTLVVRGRGGLWRIRQGSPVVDEMAVESHSRRLSMNRASAARSNAHVGAPGRTTH